jgi:hypothetical protein
MLMKIKLEDLAKVLEQSDVLQGYIDTQEGKVIVFDSRQADDEGAMERAMQFEDDYERFVAFPNVRDGEELEVMKAFAQRQKDEFRQRLLSALEGSGASVRFLRQVKRLLLLKAWQEYLHKHFLAYARWFCEENRIAYE